MTYFEDFSFFRPRNGPEVDRKWVNFIRFLFLVIFRLKLVPEPGLVNRYAEIRIFTEDLPIDYGDLIGKNEYRQQIQRVKFTLTCLF